jgi:hypothetical protein
MKPNCERHPKTVEKYDGTLKDLAKDIGNLRYDSLIELLDHLEAKIKEDADADLKGGRNRLAEFLTYAYVEVRSVKKQIGRAWEICKPYMKND